MITLIKQVENLNYKTMKLNKINLRTIIYYNSKWSLLQHQYFDEIKVSIVFHFPQ